MPDSAGTLLDSVADLPVVELAGPDRAAPDTAAADRAAPQVAAGDSDRDRAAYASELTATAAFENAAFAGEPSTTATFGLAYTDENGVARHVVDPVRPVVDPLRPVVDPTGPVPGAPPGRRAGGAWPEDD
ncbi:MAG TPA: hypothetical protein VK599_16505, partial [Streptosporangiaceae bacterium]|nr:hypothetical protein [Streptosporangiaceae bacterium]